MSQDDQLSQQSRPPIISPHQRRSFKLPIPFVRHTAPLPFFQSARRAFAAFRMHPLFTPRITFGRWRSQRALKAAAHAARDSRLDRDWRKNFRLNGLTWHHLYIAQDLRRIVSFLRELHPHIRPHFQPPDLIVPISLPLPRNSSLLSPQVAGSALVQLERTYAFLLDNVSDVYNSLEKHVLFPWIEVGIPDNLALSRAILLFSKERERIEDEADRIQSRFARLVCTTGYNYSSMGPCSKSRSFSATRLRREKRRREHVDVRARAGALKNGGGEGVDEVARRRRSSMFIREGYKPQLDENRSEDSRPITWQAPSADEVAQLTTGIHTLLEDTERLHKTERSLLYPLIAKTFSEREQLRLTQVMVYSMRSALAKFMITIYHQSVEKHATRAEWRWYKKEVPLPIRVYTPVWRARLFDGSPLGWLRTTPKRDITRTDPTLLLSHTAKRDITRTDPTLLVPHTASSRPK